MAEKSTFVKIDRNIRQWRWFKEQNTLQVWLWLLLSANIKDHDFQGDTIRRGEVATSRRTISQDTGLTERQVRTALEHLKTTGEVSVRYGSKYQVISILQYDQYQGQTSGSESGTRPAEVRQKSGTRPQSKNSKKGENGKNDCVATQPPSAGEVADFFRANGRSQADAEKFYTYNRMRGWKSGRTPMADWRAAAEMWIGLDKDVSATADDNPELDDFGRPIRSEYE